MAAWSTTYSNKCSSFKSENQDSALDFPLYKNSAKKVGIMEQARLGQLFLLLFEIAFRIRSQASSQWSNDCSGTDQRQSQQLLAPG